MAEQARLLAAFLVFCCASLHCSAFQSSLSHTFGYGVPKWGDRNTIGSITSAPSPIATTIPSRRYGQFRHVLRAWGDKNKDEATIIEESRIKIIESRRGQIRGALKAAEALRNFRINNGFVPELDENGKPLKSDSKSALTATAFVVAFGAIALRIGGRAALVSGLGLDFITENPELQGQMSQVLDTANNLDPSITFTLFTLAWTAVKVLCFDAGGIVLALSSGILFGGVLQGAIISAFAATVGSSAAFCLAKLDTPVRKKALEIMEENPSLRGIEKVVAKDGLKAILTLRLAPILPIPLGAYNYVYGVTNVPYFAFAGGIFLGSLKPYLLDSYLGYFGKSLVDGSAGQDGGLQDVILLVALGVSVLIGVFASQLASETWDTVLEEVEAEKKMNGEGIDETEDDGVTRNVLGFDLPEWVVGFQYALKDADDRINALIDQEYEAKVWNYTRADGDNPIPRELNPAFDPSSPEITGAYKDVDIGASLCDGLVISPVAFASFLKYADPLLDEEVEAQERAKRKAARESARVVRVVPSTLGSKPVEAEAEEDMLDRLSQLRARAEARLAQIKDIKEEERQ